MNPLLSTSLFLELIRDRLVTQMKSSTASMNIHTKPERKRKCRTPDMTAHSTWRAWEAVMMVLSEGVQSRWAPSSFSPAEGVWGSGTVVWAGTEGEPTVGLCKCWLEPHYSLQDSTDRRQRSTGPNWRTPAQRSHTPNLTAPAVSRSKKTLQNMSAKSEQCWPSTIRSLHLNSASAFTVSIFEGGFSGSGSGFSGRFNCIMRANVDRWTQEHTVKLLLVFKTEQPSTTHSLTFQ